MNLTLLLLAAAPLADPGPPAISLPSEVAARPGRIATITADTPGKTVRWVLASDDADLVSVPPDGKSALFCSPKPGRFVLFAWTAGGDVPSDAARCVVVVGEPPAPTPADALTADLRAAFAADPGPDKASHLVQLAAVYREAGRFAETADVGAAGELAARIRTAAGSLLPPDALTAVRKRVAAEIAKHLPDDADKPLDSPTRKLAASLFTRIAAALEKCP
ncbi:MAG: hypothetical protein ACRC7O_12340 [Fimbriiglobus sp.]